MTTKLDNPKGTGDIKALVLLSGGLDSAVSLALATQTYHVSLALTLDYGQRSVAMEKKAAKALANHYGVPHEVIALPWLSALLPQAMASGGGIVDKDTYGHGVQPVWVPNRNGLFLNLAASLAEARQLAVVIFGANAEEAVDFPDNSPLFRQAINESLRFSTCPEKPEGIQVETPVGVMTKADMIRQGIALNIPFSMIWSCYGEGPVHCGVCPSCKRLIAAIQSSGEPVFIDAGLSLSLARR